MKNIKSHFTFLTTERSGILCIILLIFLMQVVYFCTNPAKTAHSFTDEELLEFQQKIDSLKLLAINKKPKHYPFNPNFISDYKGYTLGMSTEEIDRLHAYRAQNKYVNSAKEFQEVTKVSDSLLNIVRPYFKFPEWVTNQKKKRKKVFKHQSFTKNTNEKIEKKDLNLASAEELTKVYGIGQKLSARIIKYRTKLKGFVATSQINDVYGLKPEVIKELWNHFYLVPPQIKQINLNTCELEELLQIPYINYEIADQIINQRVLREGFRNFEELIKIQNFPSDKLEIIKLYLLIQ